VVEMSGLRMWTKKKHLVIRLSIKRMLVKSILVTRLLDNRMFIEWEYINCGSLDSKESNS
jgi:hypothetical protein